MLSIPGLTCAQPAAAQDVPPVAGAIQGAVTDSSGSAVVAAVVTLEAGASAGLRTTITDEAGSFHFSAVPPGSYAITINAGGFAVWKAPTVTVVAGQNRPLPPAVLQVASASSKVDVGLSRHELATEQVKAEEQQRLLGIFPHFFVAYEPNPAPLTAAQKFQLGWKTIIDPVRLLGTGIAAGIQQKRNTYREFGQGTEGYAKRSFIRTHATSTRAPAASARDSSMPSRPHSFARAITDIGRPIIPMSWAVWRPVRSPPFTIPPVREPNCGSFITSWRVSAAERQAIWPKSSCYASSPPTCQARRHPRPCRFCAKERRYR
jgi:hypothetical protein